MNVVDGIHEACRETREKAEREMDKALGEAVSWQTAAEKLERERDEARESLRQAEGTSGALAQERDDARMALKAIEACPKFSCGECGELIHAVLGEVKR